MKLSVVMAVFNQADTLEAAVKSVLNQSFKDFEFIIVNDASTAKTAASNAPKPNNTLSIIVVSFFLVQNQWGNV
ncbi:MAG: Glycosyltransferase, group 2 family protein [Candidatus Beckwithbacteria bacterium GW2011_GWB1_47_15]|uniref:Glycosyltransferase, group 2 family protein n=1 Tax=Candidatus Beckwithbacteria bacterium GW2011_GWB1_47_15 TaxID=1618371 RepID=A0A0G1RUY5_9BACT|nr:MAG: Glycosyltransferase, group 2 family protein [Candidatus Beckwithbacteria bacterium GW2011_GWB1_47_15]